MTAIRIVDLRSEQTERIEQVARVLVDGFRHVPAWPDLVSARAEVHESFGDDRISRVALDAGGAVAGWIGGIHERDLAWELHPLVVREDLRGRGVGRALVLDLERLVAERGACTITLGTDDETFSTSLGGVDLYPDVTEHIRAIRNLDRHPYEFYQKLGYVIVGVIPDASGPGKPDILMAKRLSPPA